MPEKTEENPLGLKVFIVSAIGVITIGVIIAIPIIYSTGRHPAKVVTEATLNLSDAYVHNECTSSFTSFQPLDHLYNQEPFPYKLFEYIYRPSVISTNMSLIFGFEHDTSTWSLDKISVIDTTTNINAIVDGDFESNFLLQNYVQCILSDTRNSTSGIYFDIPYSRDFYYNDQTNAGMNYLSQLMPIIGGRYYNISFYLENRGYKNNSFVLLIGY